MKLTRKTIISINDLDERESFIATDIERSLDYQVQARDLQITIMPSKTDVAVLGFRLRPGTAGIGSTMSVVHVEVDDLPSEIQNYVLHALLDAQEGTY